MHVLINIFVSKFYLYNFNVNVTYENDMINLTSNPE